MRRIITLTVLLTTGAAQVTATACPMGLAGGGDHTVAHFGSMHAPAHDGHHAPAFSAHDRVAVDGGVAVHGSTASTARTRGVELRVDRGIAHRVIDDHASRVSAPASHAPLDAGVPCALTMSCAPLIPAPAVPLGVLGHAAKFVSPSISTHLLSAEINTTSPPPRLLA